MNDTDIQAMLIKQLPFFKEEISTCTENNNLDDLCQSIHRLIGGLEYCPGYENLLSTAKTTYQVVKNEKDHVINIQTPIKQLLYAIENESR